MAPWLLDYYSRAKKQTLPKRGYWALPQDLFGCGASAPSPLKTEAGLSGAGHRPSVVDVSGADAIEVSVTAKETMISNAMSHGLGARRTGLFARRQLSSTDDAGAAIYARRKRA